jgi:hypothetical protein
MNFFNLQPTSAATTTSTKTSNDASIKNAHTVYQNIRAGNMIKIVRLEGGGFNHCKGYIGEVKEYKQGQVTALVILHAVNTPQLIKMPIEHFIKLD